MKAKIISKDKDSFTVQVRVSYQNNMLSAEESLQDSLNEVGSLSTLELLEYFDTDGSPIVLGNTTLTSKGKVEKEYQCPYGAVVLERHVYQTSKGGKTYVPLEAGSKIIGVTTPKFAKMITSKYSCDAAPGVQRDLAENHGRPISLSYIKNLTDIVGAIAEAKEETWSYELPQMPNRVASISVGLDGANLNMMESGWREAMCGTLAFFDKEGNRMHTVYTAASPEYGKEQFFQRFEREVSKVSHLYPKVPRVGLADGAGGNWGFLEDHCEILTVDFWHVSEYLGKAAKVIYPGKKGNEEREEWLEERCHQLKHKMGGASRILNELVEFKENNKIPTSHSKELKKVITYFSNQKERMQYHKNVKRNLPIGSGVTEAACKAIVKNRMCKGSARWKSEGASVVLTLRCLHSTPFRWEKFWSKYSQYGFNFAA